VNWIIYNFVFSKNMLSYKRKFDKINIGVVITGRRLSIVLTILGIVVTILVAFINHTKK